MGFRVTRLSPWMAALLAVAGCSSASGPASKTTPPPPSLDGLPASTCASGTMPQSGRTDCVAVGTTRCAQGFARADSGWGCHAVQPGTICSGVTRTSLGQTSCVPIDDCSAAFPPPGTSVLVQPNAVAPAVSSIAAALAIVPTGGTIAVDEGTYYESLDITKSVHIVGRCASKVTIQAGNATRAAYVYGYFPAELRSMTLVGGQGGLVASGAAITGENLYVEGALISGIAGYGGSIDLTSSVLDAGSLGDLSSTQATGLTVSGGSVVTLHASEIRGYPMAVESYDPKSIVTFDASLASYGGPATMGYLNAWAGSEIKVQSSAVILRQSPLGTVGASVPSVDSGPPASIQFQDSEVYQSGYNLQQPLFTVQAGANVTLENSTLHHQALQALSVGETGSSATVDSSVIEGDSTFDVVREAVFVGTAGAATVTGSAIVNPIQVGLAVGDPGSSMTVSGSLIQGTKFVGPGPDAKLKGSGIALGVGHQGKLTVTNTTLVENEQFGLYVGQPSIAVVSGLLVDRMQQAAMPGTGILVEAGAELALTAGVLRESPESAIACASGGTIVGKTTFVKNHVALAVDSTIVLEAEAAPGSSTPQKVILYEDQYADNGSKLGPPPDYFPGP